MGKYKDVPEEEMQSILTQVRIATAGELENIGLDKVYRLERAYGKEDNRVKKAKMEAFFNAYAVVGTVKYAAVMCGLKPESVKKVIAKSDYYKARLELAHEEFCEMLEQTAIVRAVTKSDALLSFLLRANNPKKYSERMRIQAMSEDDINKSPVQISFGEVGAGWQEPNFLHGDEIADESEDLEDSDEGVENDEIEGFGNDE